jgi:hypothetical protein
MGRRHRRQTLGRDTAADRSRLEAAAEAVSSPRGPECRSSFPEGEGRKAMTTSNSKLVERLTEVIREAMRNGKHPTALKVENIPGGLTEIEGTFDLSIVACACVAEIEAALRGRLAELGLKAKGGKR